MWSADFETTSDSEAMLSRKTRVWLWALCSVDNIERVYHGFDIQSFFEKCKIIKNPVVFFHNLKFDGSFILNYLLKRGYKYRELEKKKDKLEKGEYTHLITETGVYYNILVNYEGVQIEFRDSMKKIPGSVERIGKDFKTKYRKEKIDFFEARGDGYVPTPEEISYCEKDVQVVAEALGILFKEGLERLTVGSDALAEFKKIYGKNWDFFFPELDRTEDDFVRKAYKGGWVYVNPSKKEVLWGRGFTYDVNSLYPSMMHSNVYCIGDEKFRNIFPQGKGEWYDGKYIEDVERPLFVQKFICTFTLKEGKLPFVQLKNNMNYGEHEHLSVVTEPVELTMCSIDLGLFIENYDVNVIEYIGGFKYLYGHGYFDEYINKWLNVKISSEGAKKEVAKLMLNSLYGKFCTRLDNNLKRSYLQQKVKVRKIMNEEGVVEEREEIEEVLKFEEYTGKDKKPVYTPMGTFITAYARRFTIKHAQLNLEVFCYADTDSIHLCGEGVNLNIHPTNLCAWKLEAEWHTGYFIRQKTYIEITEKEFKLVACGMQGATKKEIEKRYKEGSLKLTDIKPGFKIEGTQLKPFNCEGGTILFPSDFVLH